MTIFQVSSHYVGSEARWDEKKCGPEIAFAGRSLFFFLGFAQLLAKKKLEVKNERTIKEVIKNKN